MQKLLQNDLIIQRPLLELLTLLPLVRGQPKRGHLICPHIPDKKYLKSVGYDANSPYYAICPECKSEGAIPHCKVEDKARSYQCKVRQKTICVEHQQLIMFQPVREANFHDLRYVAEVLCGLQEEILSALLDQGEGIVWMYMQNLWECGFGGS